MAGEVGNCSNIFITTQSLISQKRYEKKLEAKNSLADQLLKTRLNALDEMETIIYPTDRPIDSPTVQPGY